MNDENWYAMLDKTFDVVRAFSKEELSSLSRKVIHQLQQMPASGIYGDDYLYKTIWDEFCHEIQEGPHEPLEYAWDSTLEPILDSVVEKLPKHVAVLISIYAAFDLAQLEDPGQAGAIWPEGIVSVLRENLAEQAGARSLEHLGPWRD